MNDLSYKDAMEATKGIVILGADHNGVVLKEKVKNFLKEKGYSCVDVGPYESQTKVDYIDYARIIGTVVHNNEARWGVLICGTGVGMSIVVNRFSGVRASLVHSLDVAQKTREHNDSNVLCLGAWVNSDEDNLMIVDAYFNGAFGEGRHVPRVEKIKDHDREKIVFTNGVFDIVHPGHLNLLTFARSLGGRLVVGINSDRAVKILKGNDRPIHDEQIRKAVLEKFSVVDEVVIFDDTVTTEIISELHPDIVVKGAEWSAEEVRKRDSIPDDIEVKVFPLVKEASGEKYSTTNIIKKIEKHHE